MGERARIYYLIKGNKKYSEEFLNYYDSLFNKVRKNVTLKLEKIKHG